VVGALKSCIGHLEACAGLASVVKTIECLERGQIPPQMHFNRPNPKIDFRDVVIPRTMLEWPTTVGQIRRAAINTFGAGGTNAHAVLESYSRQVTEALPSRKTYLFMVSAADDNALNRLSLKYADYVEQSRPELHNLAHTLLACRSKLSRSIFFAANNHVEVILKLRSQALNVHSTQTRSTKAVVCLFTGQGAQWYADCVILAPIRDNHLTVMRPGLQWEKP
jgi:acyl transferase domain-containing protein